MKNVNLFELDEEVFVKATISNIVIERGEVKYQLKDSVTGKNYGYLFTSDLITPAQYVQSVKNTNPLIEEKSKGGHYDGTEGQKQSKGMVERKERQSQRIL